MSAYITVLTVVDHRIFAYPYALLLAVCLVVFTAFFVKYPSLRTLRKKRNLIVYSVFALVCVLLGYQALDLYLGPANVSFRVSNINDQFYAGQTNQLRISVVGYGIKQVGFNLVVSCTNATLKNNDPQNYIKLNDAAVKIPFDLPGRAMKEQPVLFKVNPDVATFEFEFGVENLGTPMLVTGWVNKVIGVWNATTSNYALNIRYAP